MKMPSLNSKKIVKTTTRVITEYSDGSRKCVTTILNITNGQISTTEVEKNDD